MRSCPRSNAISSGRDTVEGGPRGKARPDNRRVSFRPCSTQSSQHPPSASISSFLAAPMPRRDSARSSLAGRKIAMAAQIETRSRRKGFECVQKEHVHSFIRERSLAQERYLPRFPDPRDPPIGISIASATSHVEVTYPDIAFSPVVGDDATSPFGDVSSS
mmetsp:Transcript_50062/g.79243  ORF Transcript_50062/g.79243 Transcript_50062/m.79243 type:complete len:161 (+) Transcript_50062:81-563(+)